MSHVSPETLGFVGTGTIAGAIVTGLCSGTGFDGAIVVSPRNAAVADDLARRFAQVQIGGSNQDVLDRSRVVFLAVRPQIAEEVLQELRFRAEHHVVSLIATYSRERIAALVSPARDVTCAVPQPTVASRAGPTVQFPPDPVAASLFGQLGPVFQVASESEFRALFTATAAMASHFAWLDTLATWLVDHGIDAPTAHRYIASMFKGLGAVPASSSKTFAELVQEFKTRGGLNEQFERHLEERHVFASGTSALDAILERIAKGANSVRSG